MTLAEATALLMSGRNVRRAGWERPNRYLRKGLNGHVEEEGWGGTHGWCPLPEDLVATDWQEYVEPVIARPLFSRRWV